MTRSRKKKASESPGAQGQSSVSREELKTPEFPEISKDHEFFLMDEVLEARRNLEAWWAQGAPELEEGHTRYKGIFQINYRSWLGIEICLQLY